MCFLQTVMFMLSNKVNMNITQWQIRFLVALRIMVGWHFLYEGLYKYQMASWYSAGYLKNANGIFNGVASYIVSNEKILSVVDVLNMWGMMAIGLGLILGLLTRPAAISGALLLCLYYLITILKL